jgi:putative transposase
MGDLILVPQTEGGLRRAIGEAHRRYSVEINKREGWRGYLLQGRFLSHVMDERHTLQAARYIERNPVPNLVARPEEWRWSSVHAHLSGADDGLVRVAPLLQRVRDWAAYVGTAVPGDIAEALRSHVKTGRPLGDEAFVTSVERTLGRALRPRVRGRRPASDEFRIVSPIS